MDKFNYQVVFKVSDDERIIFAGATTDGVGDILHHCEDILNNGGVSSSEIACENVVYQPVKINPSCHEREDPRATNE